MSGKSPANKKRRLDAETSVSSVKMEASSVEELVSYTEDGETFGEELETQRDFWKPFKNLFDSPEHSDLRFFIGKQRVPFHAHSIIFKIRCPRLARFLPSRVSGDRKMNFEGNRDIYTVRRMLQYIYTGDYQTESYINLSTFELEVDGHLLRHTKLYILAHNYDLHDLQNLCYRKYLEDSEENWDCTAFCKSIRELFGSGLKTYQDDMAYLMTNVAANHADELLESKEFLDMLESSAHISAFFVQNLLWKLHESRDSDSSS